MQGVWRNDDGCFLQLEHLALGIIYEQTPVTDSVPSSVPTEVTDYPAPDKPPSVSSSKAPPILQPKHWGASELEAKEGMPHRAASCTLQAQQALGPREISRKRISQWFTDDPCLEVLGLGHLWFSWVT